jgi:3-methyl-2-oxobutanoate hydroxymethyltransferase
MASITPQTLKTLKLNGEKFCCLTAYDSTFAAVVDQAGIETILVGDSLGMVLQGNNDTLPVTIEDMCYHVECTSRGASNALIIGDMPFMSYATYEQTLDNASALMRAGAHMVKMEGGEWLCESISALVERGVPVCGHLGLTPQSVNSLGGFKVQGRLPEQATAILEDAIALEEAGASLLVLECIPSKLAAKITQTLSIPVIGIGAGSDTDAQVLVMHDMLGLNPRAPKFVKNFMVNANSIQAAFEAFSHAVKEGSFPSPEHQFD